MARRYSYKPPRFRELEIPVMYALMVLGEIWQTCHGEENRYFIDRFGNEFFCKVPWI